MYIFCSYKQPKEKRQNHAEIGQNLNNLLNNLQAKGKFHIAGFSIVNCYYKRWPLLQKKKNFKQFGNNKSSKIGVKL